MNLNDYVKRISREDFGLPFNHWAVWNPRLRSTGGRFFPKDGHIDFNPAMYEEFDKTIFRGIVRHEFCHYHLYFAGKGYKHTDTDFKRLLKEVEGLRYAPKRLQSYKYHYICQSCTQTYQRQRRVNTNKFRCGRCRGRLILLEQT